MTRLLLQTCCAPCLTQCALVLAGREPWERALTEAPDFSVTVFFDNPNIDPPEEYDRRRGEVVKFLEAVSGEAPMNLLEDRSASRRAGWNEGAFPFRDEPERGKRCSFCYGYRLEETFRAAREGGFDAVATTLTLSPLKNTAEINRIGRELSRQYGIRYVETDFRKNNGFQNSVRLCGRYGIYRQSYCGCAYSRSRVK